MYQCIGSESLSDFKSVVNQTCWYVDLNDNVTALWFSLPSSVTYKAHKRSRCFVMMVKRVPVRTNNPT